MAYKAGFAAVKEAVEAAANSGGFGKIAHPIDALAPVSFKKDTSTVVRILSENVLSIGFHEYITCRDGKRRDFVCTEELDGDLRRPCFICRNFTREVTEKDGSKKQIPVKARNVVLAVVAVKDWDRATKKNVERQRELDILVDPSDPDGPTEKVECPTFGVLKQGVKGFWSTLNGYYAKFETYVDRDYDVSRAGEKLDTVYTILADAEDGSKPEDLWEYYGIPPVEGEDDPVFARLIEWLERRGTEDYYKRHLIGGGDTSASDDGDSSVSDEGESEGASEKSEAAPSKSFAELRSSIAKRYPKK